MAKPRLSADALSTRRNIAGAAFVLALAIAAPLNHLPPWLRVGLPILAASVALCFQVLEWRAKRRERGEAQSDTERARLALLRTTDPGGQGRVPLMRNLAPYDLGTDREVELLGGDRDGKPLPYLPRDRDVQLREALTAAISHEGVVMVVVRGPAKAGKSRTLFEAVSGLKALRGAAVLAPHDAEALSRLLEPDGFPQLPARGRVVLWLDDLERYVTATGREGLGRRTLDALAASQQRVLVVATAGGKGPLEPAGSRWTPIEQIYSDPRVRIVALSSDLSQPEQARVRSRFPREAAEQIIKHGIGEYLVAAPVLVRKLDEERHASDEWPCPEGAAVVWAAIDWSRSGMMRPVPRSLLQKLWGHYLRDGEATDERFDRALAWALAPAHRSIALLHENVGYQTYDWLLAYADDRRDIDAAVWNAILNLADPGDAMNIAAAAHARGDNERSRRALEVAKRSGDSDLAAFASLLLGEVFERQRHYRQSDAAYRRAFKSGHRDVAAMAAMSLGESLKRRGDTKGARVAFEKAIEQRHPFVSAMAAETLGKLLRNEGDLVGARVAFERAIESGHPDAAPLAQYRLGELFAQEGDTERARVAFEPALQSGHPEAAPLAQYRLAGLLADEGAPEARAAFERAAESGHPYAGPMAANDLGSWLRDNGDLDGARPWLERAIRSGHADAAPMAAYNLGLVLQQQGDLEGACASYQRAADGDHSDAAAQATCNLGSIRVQQGDLPGAIPFLRRAVASGHSEAVAKAAITLGEVLAHQGDVKGARAAYRKAEESGRPDQAAKARKGLERLLAKPTPLVAQPHPRASTGGTRPTLHGPASARGAKPEQDAHQRQDSPKAPKHNSSGGTSADGSDTGRSNNR